VPGRKRPLTSLGASQLRDQVPTRGSQYYAGASTDVRRGGSMTNTEENTWKRCSSCRKPIDFGSKYYLCSVSTCRHPRTGYRFCSVGCWDAHLGYANHRGEVWAEEAKAPSREEYFKPMGEPSARTPQKKTVSSPPPRPAPTPHSASNADIETLVVVSRVKKLIDDESGFSTSQCCIDALTDLVARACREAVSKAKAAGRKTVMGRDLS